MSEPDPYRHPAGRCCASQATVLAAFSAIAAMLLRKAVRR